VRQLGYLSLANRYGVGREVLVEDLQPEATRGRASMSQRCPPYRIMGRKPFKNMWSIATLARTKRHSRLKSLFQNLNVMHD